MIPTTWYPRHDTHDMIPTTSNTFTHDMHTRHIHTTCTHDIDYVPTVYLYVPKTYHTTCCPRYTQDIPWVHVVDAE